MINYTVKFKRVDNNKAWIAGSVKEGKYGPQIGMKMTQELRAYLDSVQVGQWLNFNLYEPYEQKEPRIAVKSKVEDDDSGIPF